MKTLKRIKTFASTYAGSVTIGKLGDSYCYSTALKPNHWISGKRLSDTLSMANWIVDEPIYPEDILSNLDPKEY